MRGSGIWLLFALCCACGRHPGDGKSGSGAPSQDGGIPPPPDDGGPAPLPAIDPYRELVIVDSSVVLDARASNGAWSFRRTVERLAPPGMTAPRVVENWLKSFRASDVAGRPVDDRPGADALLASWPRAADGSLDLARAPFQLIAIAGRLDLSSSPQGEGRLVYGLVDPATGEPGLMTIAFEYALPSLGAANDRQAWAARWHALADHPFGSEYNGALQALTDTFAT